MKKTLSALLLGLCCSSAYATKMIVPIYMTEMADAKSIGTVTIEPKMGGILLTPDLAGLPAGPAIHGFHIHDHSSCADHGTDAGGHLDPAQTGKHEGPFSTTGHLGDLPVLVVNKDGTANLPVFAPRLHMADLAGHTLMIHAGGDNYSDTPEKLGGGGARIACGVIKK